MPPFVDGSTATGETGPGWRGIDQSRFPVAGSTATTSPWVSNTAAPPTTTGDEVAGDFAAYVQATPSGGDGAWGAEPARSGPPWNAGQSPLCPRAADPWAATSRHAAQSAIAGQRRTDGDVRDSGRWRKARTLYGPCGGRPRRP